MVDTGDLKSPGHCDRAGSSPASGTILVDHQISKVQLTKEEVPVTSHFSGISMLCKF